MSRSVSLAVEVVVAVLIAFLAGALLWRKLGPHHDQIVRRAPLANPLVVIRVDDCRITLADGRVCWPEGIRLPDEPTRRQAAITCIRVASIHGLQIIPDLGDGRAVLRCEPLFNHWCGNDPILAHSSQYDLAEFLLITGYAQFDDASTGLSHLEDWRLRAAAAIATDNARSTSRWPVEIYREHRFDRPGVAAMLNDLEVEGNRLIGPPPA